jgi:anti-anti-sigma factor
MQITHSIRDGFLVVSLTGQINLSTAAQIQRTLLKDFAGQPLGIICDLSGVDAIDPVCATIFASVANQPGGRWPANSLVLCCVQPAVAEVLGRLGVAHFLPLYASLEEAVGHAFMRPAYLYEELRLAQTPTAPAAARLFVSQTLQDWRVALPDEEVSQQAQLLADELVTNAVVHARSDLWLRLELRGDLVHIAARDLDRRLLRPVVDDPWGAGGRGLRLVEGIATAWGVQHHPDGGKVVWCTLRTSERRPRR